MPTLDYTEISSDSTFNPAVASATLALETTRNNAIMAIALQTGIATKHNDLQAERGGTTVNLSDMKRANAKGGTGAADRYSNARKVEYGSRTLIVNDLFDSVTFANTGSVYQQAAAFDLKSNTVKDSVNFIKRMQSYAIMNQLAGNTATSILVPGCYDAALTSSADILRATGFNAAVAPDSTYKLYGSNAAGGVTTDQGITTTANVLKWSDIQIAKEVATATAVGRPAFEPLENDAYQYVLFVGQTGWTQLENDAVTTGQGINVAQLRYASLAGGSDIKVGKGGIPYPNFIIDDVLVIVLPNDLMPNGVHSGTAASVSTVRRAVLCGKGALDIAFGKGYSDSGMSKADMESVNGASVILDDVTYKANRDATLASNVIWGCKKKVVSGFGSYSSSTYDSSVITISHYSAR